MARGYASVPEHERLQHAAEFPWCRQPITVCAWSFDQAGRLHLRNGAGWQDPEILHASVEHDLSGSRASRSG